MVVRKHLENGGGKVPELQGEKYVKAMEGDNGLGKSCPHQAAYWDLTRYLAAKSKEVMSFS